MRSIVLACVLGLAAGCGPAFGHECPSEGCDPDQADFAGEPDAAPEPVSLEPCNGLDDNQDGRIDEGCECTEGENQPCFPDDPALAGIGACRMGSQVCIRTGDTTTWSECLGPGLPGPEVCDDIDNDCDGDIDDLSEGQTCTVMVPVPSADCSWVTCPATHPYPVGCDITMGGKDSRGCVAGTPANSMVFVKEGNDCGGDRFSGTILCSSQIGDPLDATTCTINKPNKLFPTSPSGCP